MADATQPSEKEIKDTIAAYFCNGGTLREMVAFGTSKYPSVDRITIRKLIKEIDDANEPAATPKAVKRNEEFFKEFKEISYSVNNQLYDFRLKSYEEFRGMFSRNTEIRFPFAPETEAFIKALYNALIQPQ
jgi:hypothetical protein